VDTTQTLLIEHTTEPYEEVHMSHTMGGKTSHTFYQLGKMNFEHVEKNSVIIATFVLMGKEFNECSILRMGPDSGQRRYL
jgi:hypothetical protein